MPDTVKKEQLLFGINQGGVYDDIRIRHAKEIVDLDLDGYAIGGLAVGESHEEMYRIIDSVVPHLPVNCRDYSRAYIRHLFRLKKQKHKNLEGVYDLCTRLVFCF